MSISCVPASNFITRKRRDREVLEIHVIDRGLQKERCLHCTWSLVLVFWVEDEEAQNLKYSCSECATPTAL